MQPVKEKEGAAAGIDLLLPSNITSPFHKLPDCVTQRWGLLNVILIANLSFVTFYRRSYLLLQLNHLLLLEDEVTEAVLVRVGHQSVSVVGAHLEKRTRVTKG